MAWIAWKRLDIAAKLFHKFRSPKKVLDFGSSSGELFHLLGISPDDYEFIESNKKLSRALLKEIHGAHEAHLNTLQENRYKCIFALDSFEHNSDPESIMIILKKALSKQGILVVSGPSENYIYRVGRKLAGFDGHYHKTNIFALEGMLERHFKILKRVKHPFGVTLFSITVWGRK